MKFVLPLAEIDQTTLMETYLQGQTPGLRRRAHAVLLSHKRYSINQISDILGCDRDSVSIWIERWERLGLNGLMDDSRPGRPARYNEAEQARLVELVTEEPRQLKAVQARLQEETGKTCCLKTLKTILKKSSPSATNARATRSKRAGMKTPSATPKA